VAAAKPDAAMRQAAIISCNTFFTLISVLRYVDACIGAIVLPAEPGAAAFLSKCCG
jgi:hypothetical protein